MQVKECSLLVSTRGKQKRFYKAEITGTMIDMCLSLILNHSMQHFLDQHDLHLLAMEFNSSTVTYLLLCSVTKTILSLSLNFFAHTNMTDVSKNQVQVLIVFVYVFQAMMLNNRIQIISRLQFGLPKAEEYLSKFQPDAPYSEFKYVSFCCWAMYSAATLALLQLGSLLAIPILVLQVRGLLLLWPLWLVWAPAMVRQVFLLLLYRCCCCCLLRCCYCCCYCCSWFCCC